MGGGPGGGPTVRVNGDVRGISFNICNSNVREIRGVRKSGPPTRRRRSSVREIRDVRSAIDRMNPQNKQRQPDPTENETAKAEFLISNIFLYFSFFQIFISNIFFLIFPSFFDLHVISNRVISRNKFWT